MLCDCRADLSALETEIKDAAASVDHIAAGCRSNPALSALQGKISKAKAQLLQAHDPETSRIQKRIIRNQRRKLHRVRMRLRLHCLSKRAPTRAYSLVEFEFHGEKTTDVHEWMEALQTFGATRFGNDANTPAKQMSRLETFVSVAAAEKLDGRRFQTCTYSISCRHELRWV